MTLLLSNPSAGYDATESSVAPWKQLAARIRSYKPDVVVLVARKMPRLAESFSLDFGTSCLLVSDLAIPFIHRSLVGARVAIVDDIVNVGSTVLRARRSVQACGATETRLFALGARGLSGATLEDIDYLLPEPLDEGQYAELVQQVPLILQRLAKPYDLEFPIIPCRLGLPFHTAQHVHGWLTDRFGTDLVHLIAASEDDDGLTRLSVDMPTEHGGNQKLRLYVDADNRRCHVVPFAIPAPVLTGRNDASKQGRPHSLLAGLLRRLDGFPSNAALWPEEPFIRARLFARSLDFGLQQLQNIKELVSVETIPPVSLPDVELLFGPVEGLFDERDVPGKIERVVEVAGEVSSAANSQTPFVDSFEQTGKAFRDRLRFRTLGKSGFALFTEIFNELADAVGASDPARYSLSWPYAPGQVRAEPYLRLRVGLTFHDLVALYDSLMPSKQLAGVPVRNQVSAMLDYAIDEGAVVPTIAKYNDGFYRVYRKGENEARDKAMDRVLYAWRMYGKPLSLTRFTKINAILAFSAELPQVLMPSTLTRGNVASLQNTVLDSDEVEVGNYALRTGRLDEQQNS